jgi:hypothetical protein
VGQEIRHEAATEEGRQEELTDAQHAAFQEYLHALAQRLILADWVVELKREPAEDGAIASVCVWDVENYASVYLRWPDFFHKSRDSQRETLVHELLHLVTDRPKRVMEQLAEQLSDNSACQFAREAHRKELEIVVQRLARILAPGLPLPPKVKA